MWHYKKYYSDYRSQLCDTIVWHYNKDYRCYNDDYRWQQLCATIISIIGHIMITIGPTIMLIIGTIILIIVGHYRSYYRTMTRWWLWVLQLCNTIVGHYNKYYRYYNDDYRSHTCVTQSWDTIISIIGTIMMTVGPTITSQLCDTIQTL